MKCKNCGTEFSEGIFCPECGTRFETEPSPKTQVEENYKASNTIEQPQVMQRNSKKDVRNKGGKLKYIVIGIFAILVIAIFIAIFAGGNKYNEEYISMVQNGYLGEFTDVTVKELFEEYFVEDYKFEWTNGTMDDGAEMVGLRAYTEDGMLAEVDILFRIFPEQGLFKVVDYVDGAGDKDYEATELASILNEYYRNWYLFKNLTSDASDDEGTKIMTEVVEKLDGANGVAVLYGASKDYIGDRARISTIIDGIEPLDISATEIIDMYYDNMLSDFKTSLGQENVVEDTGDESVSQIGTSINYSQIYDYAFDSLTDTEYGSYYLWDLDGNGIYELILGHGENAADYVNDIWTIGDDGGILGIGTIGGESEFYVAPDYNGIYAVYGHMGYESISRITLVNGEIVEEVISEREIGEDEDYYSSEMVIASADINDRSLLERISSMGTDTDIQLEQSSEYIFSDSDSVYLTEADLEGLTQSECKIARNEIYARHGRLFKDKTLQAYFDSCSWYIGMIPGDEFDDSVLNEYEIANRDLIAEYEKSQGF